MDENHDGALAVDEVRPDVKAPRKYAAVLHNDDYTTMECVVEILQRIFGRTTEEATTITLSVHHKGKGVAGIYSYEIAETKAMQAVEWARKRQFPLRCSVEPAEGEEDSKQSSP